MSSEKSCLEKKALDIFREQAHITCVSVIRTNFRCGHCGWTGQFADSFDCCPVCSFFAFCEFCEEPNFEAFRDRRCSECRREALWRWLTHRCSNCHVRLGTLQADLCAACAWLSTQYTDPKKFGNASIFELPGLVNRRWQMFINFGWLKWEN